MSSLKHLLLLALLAVVVAHRDPHRKKHSSSSSSSSEEDRRHGRVHVHRSRSGGKIRVGASRPAADVPVRTTMAPPVLKCPAGWMTLDRNGNKWCVKVDYLPGDQPHAEKYCKSQGATLTGLHSSTERMKIADEGLKIITKLGHKVGGIWLGAQSKNGCHKDSAKCGALSSFEWTDKSTKGSDGFKWGKKEPDNTFWGKPACVQQIIIAPDYRGRQYSNFEHGDLDKFCCQHEKEPTVKLYACGKEAEYGRP